MVRMGRAYSVDELANILPRMFSAASTDDTATAAILTGGGE